eukprot:5172046-Ditylum_brightwellii.AAC.1
MHTGSKIVVLCAFCDECQLDTGVGLLYGGRNHVCAKRQRYCQKICTLEISLALPRRKQSRQLQVQTVMVSLSNDSRDPRMVAVKTRVMLLVHRGVWSGERS